MSETYDDSYALDITGIQVYASDVEIWGQPFFEDGCPLRPSWLTLGGE